jgi:hypothetical protein
MPDAPSPLRLVGRDVLFVHWAAPVDVVRAVGPEPLTVDTAEGSAWLSVLIHEVSETTLASVPVSRPFVQVNFRTYVRFDGDPGVYFRSLGAGNRADRRAPGTSPAWSASISFRGRSDPDFPATTIPS